MSTDRPTGPVILLVEPDPLRRFKLSSEIASWSSGSLPVIPLAGMNDTQAAITNIPDPDANLMAIIAASEKIGGLTSREFLDAVVGKHRGVLKILLTEFPGKDSAKDTEDGYVDLPMTAETLDRDFENLLHEWSPSDPHIKITGPKNTEEAYILRCFLYLNAIPHDWPSSTEETHEINVEIDGVDIGNPSLGELYRALEILPEPSHEPTQPYDLIVVGAGPAGLAAALSASRAGIRTLVIEASTPGGAAATSINPVGNYLGFPGGIKGRLLVRRSLAQVSEAATDHIDWRTTCQAESLRREGSRYLIDAHDEDGDFRFSTAMVLLACGNQAQRLPIEKDPSQNFRLRGVWGMALESDLEFERDKNIVIVGGGDSAGEAALMFAEASHHVTIIARDGLAKMGKSLQTRLLKASPQKVTILQKHHPEIVQFVGGDALAKVVVRTSRKHLDEIDATSAYVLIGGTPNTEWLDGSGISLDAAGFVKTDVRLSRKSVRSRHVEGSAKDLPPASRTRGSWRRRREERVVHVFETNLPGVFAAGDVRASSFRRIGQAAGQGTAVVASMQRYLEAKGPRVLADSESKAYRRYGPF